MMMLFLDSTIRASFILAAALCSVRLLRRRPAAVRHAVLSVAMLCAATLPILRMALPSWHVIPSRVMAPLAFDTPPQSPAVIPERNFERWVLPEHREAPPAPSPVVTGRTEAPTGEAAMFSVAQVLRCLWLLGASAFCAALAFGAMRLARIASMSE